MRGAWRRSREGREHEPQRPHRAGAAQKAAEEKAAQAPDREKLLAFVATLDATPMPEMTTVAGEQAAQRISLAFERFTYDISEEAAKL